MGYMRGNKIFHDIIMEKAQKMRESYMDKLRKSNNPEDIIKYQLEMKREKSI